MKIITLEQIRSHLDIDAAILMQEEGFKLYSQHKAVIPPVGYLKIPHTPVSYHIKYGVIDCDDVFVVKFVGGLEYSSKKFGQSCLHGMSLVFSALTGEPLYYLQDHGYLTQLRTALAGCIVAKYLAPNHVRAIGIIGTGEQSYLQATYLSHVTPCRNIVLWGRNKEKCLQYQNSMVAQGYSVEIVATPRDVAKKCNLIVTTTASREPLLMKDDIQHGTHITALGADAPEKQEFDPNLVAIADTLVVDSISQCSDHGEISHALRAGLIEACNLIELGTIIEDSSPHRPYKRDEHGITIADLTGIAVQDIMIAKTILQDFEKLHQ
jgi:ornithine cyclodeaminase